MTDSNHSSLEEARNKTWRRQHTTLTPCHVKSIRLIQNHLYACHDHGIYVYTTDLHHVDTINTTDSVLDVCDMHKVGLIVASTNGLYHHKDNGASMLVNLDLITKAESKLISNTLKHLIDFCLTEMFSLILD